MLFYGSIFCMGCTLSQIKKISPLLIKDNIRNCNYVSVFYYFPMTLVIIQWDLKHFVCD